MSQTDQYYKQKSLVLADGRIAILKKVTYNKRTGEKLAIVTYSGETFSKAIPYSKLTPFIPKQKDEKNIGE